MAVMGVTANINIQMLFVGKFYAHGGAASEGRGDDGVEVYGAWWWCFFPLNYTFRYLSLFSLAHTFFYTSIIITLSAMKSLTPLYTQTHVGNFTALFVTTFLSCFNPYP